MVAKRGISLLDLIEIPEPGRTFIPPDIEAQLEQLSIVEYRSATSDETFTYYGTVQSLADLGLPALRKWPVEAPGLNVGIPFQLTVRRQGAAVPPALEPATVPSSLDLFLDRVSVVVPGLKAAVLVPSAGVNPAHLLHSDAPDQKVRLVGSGVLRITPNPDPAGGPVVVRFIDQPDPFDPDAPTGPVFTIGFSPPHFFIGGSEVGLTVDRLTFDDSEEFTPPEIVARGQPAAWRGLAIKEATLYLPRNAPLIGDASVGVREVLLGSPLGLQGELRIELGQSQTNPLSLFFFQRNDTGDTPLAATQEQLPDGAGTRFEVTLAQTVSGERLVRASSPQGTSARWVLPDHTEVESPDTPYFSTKAGDTLVYQPIERVENADFLGPEVPIQFSGAGAVPGVPHINLQLASGQLRSNVVHVSGAPAELDGLTFVGDPPSDTYFWHITPTGFQLAGHGPSFVLHPSPPVGSHRLVMRDATGRERRVEIQNVLEGKLIIATEAGIFDLAGQPVKVRGVEATWDLRDFHTRGMFSPAAERAALVAGAAAGADVTVPGDALAQVTLELGSEAGPDAPPTPTDEPPPPVRHFELFMQFDSTNPIPAGGLDQLLAFAGGFDDGDFVLIGRCDDIGSDTYNKDLAQRRADVAGEFLIARGVAPNRIYARGEQSTWTEAVANTGIPNPQPANAGFVVEATIDPPLSSAELGGRLVNTDPTKSTWARTADDKPDKNEPRRAPYRRVDVYAVAGVPNDDALLEDDSEERLDPLVRRSYRPGPDSLTPKKPEPRMPRRPYLIRLVVKWDSPTVVELSDAIPTLVELTVARQAEPLLVPGLSGSDDDIHVTPVRDPAVPGPEIFTWTGRWSYDARSGQTVFSLALDSSGDPNGLFFVGGDNAPKHNVLATVLALGPALIAGAAAPTGSVDDTAIRAGALVAAGLAAGAFARNGKVVVFGVEVEERQRALDSLAGSRQRLLCDYTVQVGFEVTAAGIGLSTSADKPLKVRYKNVGVELDNAREGLDKFGLVYEDVSFEIEDPGQWTISGPLGELLRVTGARAGSGSQWYEIDLRFALDTGPITVTGATIRLSFSRDAADQPHVELELRGLAVDLEIPGTLRGGGQLKVGAGGALSAALDLEVIPAGIEVLGALNLSGSFAQIEIGVRFATGLPLGLTGLGVFGFVGRFVANGTRDLSGTSPNDPVQRELDWFKKPLLQKYMPQPGQWALGLGALVGTLPDGAFLFNALGMFTVSHPEPSVIFGVDVTFLSTPRLPIESPPPPAAGTPPPPLKIVGLVVKDPSALMLGLRADYEIPHLLTIKVPISGYFPAPSTPGDAYVRIGADGFEGRVGDPMTYTFLPGTLDVRASGFLMFEERQLHRLGGDERLDFDGFSVGFGAQWNVDWSAGSIRLTGSARLLAGLGTAPRMLAAVAAIRGELSLVVVNVSVTGDAQLRILENERRLEGEFCASVDLLFFSLEGCVSISIGTDPGAAVPVPPNPLVGIDLTDRRGLVTGHAAASGALGPEHTAWPDTAPVLHFSHYVETALGAGSAFGAPVGVPGPVWSGTSELKYAYRVTKLELLEAGVPLSGPFDAAWWLPSSRPAVTDAADPPPGEVEGRELSLLSWHPAPWARNLGSSGAEARGDPAATLGRVCTPSPTPERVCLRGERARRDGVNRVELRSSRPSPPPFPSTLRIVGRESLGTFEAAALLDFAIESGYTLVAGRVERLSVPSPLDADIIRAYELPYLSRNGRLLTTLSFAGTIAPAAVAPELVLALTLGAKEAPIPECDEYTDLKIGTRMPLTFSHGELRYETLNRATPLRVVDRVPAGKPDGTPELQFPAKGFRVRAPLPVAGVSVHLRQAGRTAIQVRAFDGHGAVVDTAKTTRQNVLEPVTVSGPDIRAVVVTGGGGRSVVARVCFQFEAAKTVADEPRVSGTLVDGQTHPWKAEALGPVVSGPDGRRCRFVRYTPAVAGTWKGVRIDPWAREHVGIVSACALSWAAADAHDRDQQARLDLSGLWNDRGQSGVAARPELLNAGTTYQVRVQCQYQGWRRTDDEPEPSPIDPAKWLDLPQATYSFRTADAAAASTAPPDLRDESVFDARGVARYLLGFEPDGTAAPHFRADPLQALFSVDHLDLLLSRYGRSLALKLRRTNPPPGSLHGVATPPDVPATVTRHPLVEIRQPASDRRMLETARAAPCLTQPPPALGGTTLDIAADLEPGGEYDLLLVAPPANDPASDEVLVARAHFKASRHRDPVGLIESLGFGVSRPNPILPHEAVVTGAMPTTPSLRDDAALDATLVSLGLDPFPLPKSPRTTLLWRNQNGFKLAGVLLEADEPFERGIRTRVINLTLGAATLVPRRSNAAGTRMLLAADGLIAVGANDLLSLLLQQPSGLTTARRYLAGGPRFAALETV